MSAFTAEQMTIGRAPKLIQLFGDKVRKVESAQHIIEFPGGAIEVSRCTDGTYWAHILINHGFDEGDAAGFTSARGEVLASRIQRDGEWVQPLEGMERITQIAVRIGRATVKESLTAEGEAA